jgi:hypothetical protein
MRRYAIDIAKQLRAVSKVCSVGRQVHQQDPPVSDVQCPTREADDRGIALL